MNIKMVTAKDFTKKEDGAVLLSDSKGFNAGIEYIIDWAKNKKEG